MTLIIRAILSLITYIEPNETIETIGTVKILSCELYFVFAKGFVLCFYYMDYFQCDLQFVSSIDYQQLFANAYLGWRYFYIHFLLYIFHYNQLRRNQRQVLFNMKLYCIDTYWCSFNLLDQIWDFHKRCLRHHNCVDCGLYVFFIKSLMKLKSTLISSSPRVTVLVLFSIVEDK